MASNITPGTQQYCEVTAKTGLAGSITQDVFTPVEFGRTALTSAYTTTDSGGLPIPPSSVEPATFSTRSTGGARRAQKPNID